MARTAPSWQRKWQEPADSKPRSNEMAETSNCKVWVEGGEIKACHVVSCVPSEARPCEARDGDK